MTFDAKCLITGSVVIEERTDHIQLKYLSWCKCCFKHFLFERIIDFILRVWVFSLRACEPYSCSAQRTQERALDPLELNLQTVVHCRVGNGNSTHGRWGGEGQPLLPMTDSSLQPDLCRAFSNIKTLFLGSLCH